VFFASSMRLRVEGLGRICKIAIPLGAQQCPRWPSQKGIITRVAMEKDPKGRTEHELS
jgi:hypothetical protein